MSLQRFGACHRLVLPMMTWKRFWLYLLSVDYNIALVYDLLKFDRLLECAEASICSWRALWPLCIRRGLCDTIWPLALSFVLPSSVWFIGMCFKIFSGHLNESLFVWSLLVKDMICCLRECFMDRFGVMIIASALWLFQWLASPYWLE